MCRSLIHTSEWRINVVDAILLESVSTLLLVRLVKVFFVVAAPIHPTRQSVEPVGLFTNYISRDLYVLCISEANAS